MYYLNTIGRALIHILINMKGPTEHLPFHMNYSNLWQMFQTMNKYKNACNFAQDGLNSTAGNTAALFYACLLQFP